MVGGRDVDAFALAEGAAKFACVCGLRALGGASSLGVGVEESLVVSETCAGLLRMAVDVVVISSGSGGHQSVLLLKRLIIILL